MDGERRTMNDVRDPLSKANRANITSCMVPLPDPVLPRLRPPPPPTSPFILYAFCRPARASPSARISTRAARCNVASGAVRPRCGHDGMG
eukprot:16610-Chlamydomonas_euryale.AAC.18